jgi:hypothetical protein
VRLDAQSPTGQWTNAPPGGLTNQQPGFIDIQWTDSGLAGLDPATFDATDVTITGVTVTEAVHQGSGLVRYSYSGSLAGGTVEVTRTSGAVSDLAGNTSPAGTDSFQLDTHPPGSALVSPAPGSTISQDPGYIDIQWSDPGPASLDQATIDATDIVLSGVDVDSVQDLGNGLFRYHYNSDGDALADGPVQVNMPSSAVRDLAGNTSAAASASFTLQRQTAQPLTVVEVRVNDGVAQQRSNIETVSVRFNQTTNLQQLIDNGSISAAVQLLGSSPVSLETARFRYDASTYTLMIDLTTDRFGPGRSTMLADARYQLRLDTAMVRSTANARLQDDDGTDDLFRSYEFHRLLADWDGNGVVGAGDLDLFYAHYGATSTSPKYDFAYDTDANGIIDRYDYNTWRSRYGRRV